MLNSRAISDLRPDVATNCRTLLSLCKQQGLNVLVTQTMRDNEYQAALYAQGRTKPGSIVTNSKTTTFHGCGLAFDFCKNVKGHEYDDPAFFAAVAAIAKGMGFSWGGDWKSFPDKPHLQWDAHGSYTSSMIRAGKYPPNMEEYMSYEDFKAYMVRYENEQAKQPVSAWAKTVWDKLTKKGITDGTRPRANITREEAILMLDRMEQK